VARTPTCATRPTSSPPTAQRSERSPRSSAPSTVASRVAGAIANRSGEYQTPNGHRVVADAGYNGSAPGGLVLGQSWIYGSGPVYYRMSELEMPGQWWESFNRVHNDFVVQVVRYALYMFDPAFVVGGQADVQTSND
jgi:hypothetical protein